MNMRPFKFFNKPFNTDDYDVTDFRFLGVTPVYRDNNGRNSRNMIYVFTDGTIVPAQIIHDDHDAYNYADVFEVRGNQVFLLPRSEGEYINVTLTFTPHDRL
jgi:hypothetical protein